MGKYKTAVATVNSRYEPWLRAEALPIDIESKKGLCLARDIDSILTDYIHEKKWIAASSNNVFYGKIDVPVRVMRVEDPAGNSLVSLINPVIRAKGGVIHKSLEACAGIPNAAYIVPRHSYISIEGYLLEGKNVRKTMLKFGQYNVNSLKKEVRYLMSQDEEFKKSSKWIPNNEIPIWLFHLWRKKLRPTVASVVQHELDHLDGKILSDYEHKVELKRAGRKMVQKGNLELD